MNPSVRRLATVVCMTVVLPVAAGSLQAKNQAGAMIQEQYRIAAEKAKTEPFKVDIRPVQQSVQLGASAVITIELRNANDQPVNALQPMTLEVKTKTPSQTEQIQKVQIAPNTSSAAITLTPQQAGIWKLEVREVNDHLKSGSSYLLVSSAPAAPAQTQKKSKPGQKKASPNAAPKSPPGALLAGSRLVMAAYEFQPQGDSLPQPAAQPGIILKVSGEGDGKVRADGTTAASVSVFLLSPQTTDVHVWLAVSQGQLEKPMVTIPRGQYVAEVSWTSTTPVDQAKVTVIQTSPQIAGQDLAGATVDFVDPIVAIAFVNPLSRMSIVELGTVAVRFVDKNARPVPAHLPLSYRFSANSAHVRLTPVADQTKPGAVDFSTDISPSALGTVTIEAAVQGLQPIKQPVEITGVMLLVFCALGGAAGGLVNHLDLKRKGLWASLMTAAIVALPVTWLYVWVGLPNLNAAFLHNQLSAVMIAIIAGVAGASGLKAAAKLFGIALFEPPAGDGGAASKAAGAKP